MLYSILFIFLSVASSHATAVLESRSPWIPQLFACANELAINNTAYFLTDATTFSQYLQCTYTPTIGSNVHCWYDYQTYNLDHTPNTPIAGEDSNPACPTSLPLAQTYAVRTNTGVNPNDEKCITMSSNSDGAALVVKTCDGRHNYPNQQWTFVGSTIVNAGSNKCIDVTDGQNRNGNKMQVWTCFDGNSNQQFYHWVHNFLVVPEDHISWMSSPDKCLDLTDGKLVEGNPVQIWDCDYSNPNQARYLSF